MRADRDYRPREDETPDRTPYWIAGALAVAIIGLAWYLWSRPDVQPEVEISVATPPPAPAQTAPAEPEIRHPVPEPAAPEEPLPSLDESDAAFGEALAKPYGAEAVGQFLVPDGAIRRIVATVDNLPREKIANQIRATKPIAGNFTVTGKDQFSIGADNPARYAAFIKLVDTADPEQLAEIYFRFYPLFQEAYAELGFPDRHFNDRLVEVIDHLLETPDLQEPPKLVRPRVFYEFADPALEARSAGQKTLLRMGRENALVVKKKLYELRRAITSEDRM